MEMFKDHILVLTGSFIKIQTDTAAFHLTGTLVQLYGAALPRQLLLFLYDWAVEFSNRKESRNEKRNPVRNTERMGQVLEPFNINHFDWYIGGEEAYQDTGGGNFKTLFQGEVFGMKGQDLNEILKSSRYYIIFANFKAYPKGESIEDVLTYEEFLESQCQLALIVIDSSYATVYCKDKKMLDDLYLNAIRKGFEKVEYITDENDFRTRLSV